MAQIRKYGNGGGAEKKENPPTLFHWEGIGDYDVKDMETTYARNLETYLNSLNVDEEDKARVRDISYGILQNTKNGVITTRDASGKWLNVPVEYQSTGQFNMRGPRKKKYEKDSNYYNNLSYQVIDNVLRDTALYGTPKEQDKAYDKLTSYNFENDLIKYYFNDGKFNPNYWDYSKARTEIPLRVAEFKQRIINSNLSDADKKDMLERISQVETAFQTEDPNDDYYGLVRLMNDPRRWFDKNYTLSPEVRAQLEQEQKALEEVEKQKAQQYVTNTVQSATNNGQETDIDTYYNPVTKNTYYGVIRRGLFFPTTSESGASLTPFILGNTPTYEGLDSRISWDPNSEGSYSWENFDAARRLMNTGQYEKYRDQFDKIKSVFEEYLKLNPEIKLQNLNTKDLFATYKSLYNIQKTPYVTVPVDTTARTYMLPDGSMHTYKLGGVVKLQEGGTLADLLNKVNSDPYYKNKQSKKDQETRKKEESKQKTGFENSDDLHTEWSTADKYRIGAIAGDVVSLLLSMSGVGSVASALTGAGSTTANVYADTLEGKTTGEAVWDNLGSYALDAISLLPFAKAAKVPKIIKAVSQYTPKITAAIAGIQGLVNADEYISSFNKLSKGEKLTVGDWRNIANGLQVVLGGAAATHRASVGKSNVEAVRSADKVWLKTDQGWKSIDQDLAKKLSEAPDLKTQNELLKDTGITLTESLNWKFKGKGKNEIKTTPLYDFNKEAIRYSGDVDIHHKFGPGERALGKLQFPSINFLNKVPVRNAYNWMFHNKAYNRYKKSNANTETTNNWWKERGKDVEGATDSFAEAMRKADEYNKKYGRLALPPKTQGPEIPSNSAKPFVMQESIPVSRPAQKEFDKSVKEFYNSIDNTNLQTPNLVGTTIDYTPPILRTPNTITFEQARRNNYQIEKLRQDRALNNAKNQDRKEFNRLVDKENKDKRQKKLEEKRKNYSKMIEDLVKKQQVRNYSPTLPNRSANQVGSESFNWFGYQKDMEAKAQTEAARQLAEKRSRISGKNNQKENSEKKKLAKKKTKKNNKESKGYVNKHQQGGIVKYQNPSGPFRIGAKDKWTLDDRNKALANYNFAGDVQSYLNSGSDIDSYIAAFNAGEDLYDKMVGDTNYFTNMSGNYRKEDPLAYQRQMTFRNTNKGFDDLIRGSIIGYGVTEGASNFDKYLGDRTYNRTLGYLTPEQATAYNKQINQFGMELFQSPNNKNHYRLRKIPGWVDPKSSSNLASKTLSDTINNEELPQLMSAEELIKSAASGRNAQVNSDSTKTNNGLINIIPDLLGTARLAGTIWTNNRVAKDIKNSLSPLLIDPPQIRRSVVGDLATRNYMEKLGAEANRIGSRPITSDASLQLGQALDYNNRANEYRMKGYLADKQAIDKTSLAAQEAAEQNAIARVDAANRNRASMLGIRQAKANVEAQRKSANWSQAVAPWLMDKEFRMRQNQKMLNSLNYEGQDFLDRQTLEEAYDQAQAKLNQAKQQFLNSGGTEETWVGSPQYNAAMKTYNQDQKNAANTYLKSRLDNQRAIYSSPWIMFKSGGKLSYAERAALEHDKAINKSLLQDSKEFNKIIRESKKENNKLILSLSGLSKELVIKSMTYAG